MTIEYYYLYLMTSKHTQEKLFHWLTITYLVSKGTQFHTQVHLSATPNGVVSLTVLTQPLQRKEVTKALCGDNIWPARDMTPEPLTGHSL